MPSPKFFHHMTPGKPRRDVYGTKILLVEGQDECWMFDRIFSDRMLDQSQYQIIEYGGKANLADNLANMITQDRFLDDEVSGLAILIDADQSYSKTLYDLEAAVSRAGLGTPGKGTFAPPASKKKLRVGAFIMPDNASSGALETLLIASVATVPALVEATNYVIGHAPKKAKDPDKRISQVYLAAQEDLCRGVGRGARNGSFDLTSKSLAPLTAFIDEFCALPG